MRESIDLIDEIRKINRDSQVIFTTFKYDKNFFEKFIFSHFKGKTLPIVFVDYGEYQNVLISSGPSRLAGKQYLLDSIRIPNRVFHPKFILACSKKEIKLIISSANLTPAGYSTNAEICSVETIPFEKRNDYPILHQTCDFLVDLQNFVESESHRQSIKTLIEMIDIGTKSSKKRSNTNILHNVRESILDQVRKIIGGKVEKIFVLSPFFSQDLDLYDKIVNEFTENIEFIIQSGNNNFPNNLIKNSKYKSIFNYSNITFGENRSLHAKMMLFRTGSKTFALTGSANFTKPALSLISNKGGNMEVCLLRQSKLEYFDYLLDPSIVNIQKINLQDITSINLIKTFLKNSNFRILEAKIVGEKLHILFDYEFVGNLNAIIHIDNIEKPFNITISSKSISIPLSLEDLKALTISSIVSIKLEDNKRILSSDLKLIHHPEYFPEQFSVLNTIIDEDERTWLFKIFNRYNNLPDLNYILPIIERMEEYDLFDLKPIEREELLLKLKAKLANVLPYSASDQIIRLIDKFRTKHQNRIEKTIKSMDLKQLPIAINSFLIINKLIIWLVQKDLEKPSYLRYIRSNIDLLFENEYIDMNNNEVTTTLYETKLPAHIILLSYIVDSMRQNSNQYLNSLSGKRDYVKDVFDETFLVSIFNLRDIVSDKKLEIDLKSISWEYNEIIPKMDMTIENIFRGINRMIENANSKPNKKHTFSSFQLIEPEN